MQGLKQKLKSEEQFLKKIIHIAKRDLKNSPQGSLQISKTHNSTQFIHFLEQKKIYIRKENEELVQRLAQKKYDESILRLAEKRLKQIQKITKDYDDQELDLIYLKEHPERKKRIIPVEQPWEDFVENWIQTPHEGLPFSDSIPLIMTDHNERVRSKSEKIIADYLFRNNIPYKYEKPLFLQGLGTIHPDFTLLSKHTHSEIYWEHLGRMDDPEYIRKAIQKIHAYEKNDFFLGDRLILTYETSQLVLDNDILHRIVEHYFL